jgi:membrane associated rhomboid family serine protease
MDKDFKYTNKVIALPLFLVLGLWFVYWFEVRFHFNFTENGILPRTLMGLQGIAFSPFIHSDISHLYSNSVPLLVLLAALQFFYSKQSFDVIVYGIVLSGFLTWIIGRNNYHIGASGLVYVLVGFIFLKGILTRYYRLVALSLSVIIVYGGMVWFVFPKVDDTISWEGHLSGLITGFLFAIFFKNTAYRKIIKYEWEHPDYDASQDKFMQRFDQNGNFTNPPIVISEHQEYFHSDINVNYSVVSKIKNESDSDS